MRHELKENEKNRYWEDDDVWLFTVVKVSEMVNTKVWIGSNGSDNKTPFAFLSSKNISAIAIFRLLFSFHAFPIELHFKHTVYRLTELFQNYFNLFK